MSIDLRFVVLVVFGCRPALIVEKKDLLLFQSCEKSIHEAKLGKWSCRVVSAWHHSTPVFDNHPCWILP